MAEYADIKIKNYSLWSFRNQIDLEFLQFFFLQSNLKTESNVKFDKDDVHERPHTKYSFVSDVRKVKDRLDSMGFSVRRCCELIETNKQCCFDYINYLFSLNVDVESLDEVAKNRAAKYTSFKKYYNALKRCVNLEEESGCSICFSDDYYPKTECDKIIYYSSKDNDCSSFYGIDFNVINPLYIIRLILEFFDEKEIVECDVSPLIGWTYETIDETKLVGIKNKIIVLVEGTSDKAILEYSLGCLYPHLSDVFYFMDFEYANTVKREGGADSIRNNIKAFIMSRLDTKFIALFDNDTVGYFAKEKLISEIKVIPDNIRALTYPDLPDFKFYPTLSPNGKIVKDNINKRACSIELYLPTRLISDEKGFLYPIEWESQIKCKIGEKMMQSYQGVISNKQEIKKRFVTYKNKASFKEAEWQKMKSLLNAFVFLFA